MKRCGRIGKDNLEAMGVLNIENNDNSSWKSKYEMATGMNFLARGKIRK